MSEREQIVSWLREQSDKGAGIANGMNKGSTARASYGGGSYALSIAADAIERGDHISNDNDIIACIARDLAAGRTESQSDG